MQQHGEIVEFPLVNLTERPDQCGNPVTTRNYFCQKVSPQVDGGAGLTWLKFNLHVIGGFSLLSQVSWMGLNATILINQMHFTLHHVSTATNPFSLQLFDFALKNLRNLNKCSEANLLRNPLEVEKLS